MNMRMIPKNCAHCSGKFNATSGVAKYCCDRCHLLAQSHQEGGCRIWTGSLDKDGYGDVKLRGGRRTKAHRAAYEEFIGPIPNGKMVCHSCDTPACIEPEHLFDGTALDNKTDSVVKGRHVHGTNVYWTNKLTEAQALSIISDARHRRVIAGEYGVSAENVDAIRSRKTWKHLAPMSV